MLYEYGKQTRDFLRRFYFFKFSLLYFWGFFNKTIIPLALVGYEMVLANSALCTSLAIYHFISNARLWNNCYLREEMCTWYNKMEKINTSFQNVVQAVSMISIVLLEKLKALRCLR